MSWARCTRKRLATVSTLTVALWMLSFIWLVNHGLFDLKRIAKSEPKTILYWGFYFDYLWEDAGYWPMGVISCSGGLECFVTDNESDYVRSDAVLFHSAKGTRFKDLPPAALRPPQQVWVFLTFESPPHQTKFHEERDLINWTMTYLHKSDVVVNYGKIIPGRFGSGFDSSRNYLEGKNRSVVAVISNCLATERLQFVKTLSKFIDVDVFGKCGKKRLCHDCWNNLKHYKFYLASENYICTDYVTEKFFVNGLRYGMIPVVVGGAKYSDPSIAPPGSYISVKDFTSMQELAKFLEKVGSEPQLYNQYFHWYSHYTVAKGSLGMCDLCTRLHRSRTTKVYSDALQWFRIEGACEAYPNLTYTYVPDS